ncbi:hypothetical protein PoB_006453700 [Plakobranchus ocellatus]|uniref:Uncharacterized protein n=1 Tax=Plakobranchus ocellatus TaxID=259542 RepID=A0AAV4D1G8_9GAST|nr:hypothetical protein PoB_006453700 [Plakobranchus ocellatus]
MTSHITISLCTWALVYLGYIHAWSYLQQSITFFDEGRSMKGLDHMLTDIYTFKLGHDVSQSLQSSSPTPLIW